VRRAIVVLVNQALPAYSATPVNIVTQVPLLVPTVQQDTSVTQGLLVQRKISALGVNTALQERARLSLVQRGHTAPQVRVRLSLVPRAPTAPQEFLLTPLVPQGITALREFLLLQLVLRVHILAPLVQHLLLHV
jgi:hypothetical protein